MMSMPSCSGREAVVTGFPRLADNGAGAGAAIQVGTTMSAFRFNSQTDQQSVP